MITSGQCLNKFGRPGTGSEGKYMTLWVVPPELAQGKLPKRVYCNLMMVEPLKKAFTNIIKRGLLDQVKEWNGCYLVRQKRGGTSWSMHAWGLAIDINASTNGFGHKPTMSRELVACFTDTGSFDWGGVWGKPDGMHFQLKNF